MPKLKSTNTNCFHYFPLKLEQQTHIKWAKRTSKMNRNAHNLKVKYSFLHFLIAHRDKLLFAFRRNCSYFSHFRFLTHSIIWPNEVLSYLNGAFKRSSFEYSFDSLKVHGFLRNQGTFQQKMF